MAECKHIGKVLKWGIDRTNNEANFIVESWGCTKCDWQGTECPS